MLFLETATSVASTTLPSWLTLENFFRVIEIGIALFCAWCAWKANKKTEEADSIFKQIIEIKNSISSSATASAVATTIINDEKTISKISETVAAKMINETFEIKNSTLHINPPNIND